PPVRMLTETAQTCVPALPAGWDGFRRRAQAGAHVAKRTEPARPQSWLCRLFYDNSAEFQMLFRCIRSPIQQCKEKRCQKGECGESGNHLPERTCWRCLRRGGMRQPAQTRRASQLSFLIRYAFAA